MKDEPRHPEHCFFCGQTVDLDDDDAIQVHGGENGIAHESCWREAEAENGPEAA